MYQEKADGSAVVWGVLVAPFVPLQHLQMDVSTVNRLGNHCFRFARERGWLQTAREVSEATPYAQSDDSRPLVEQEGHAYAGAPNTFFFAGVEEDLHNPIPHFRLPPTPSTLLASARLHLVHMGNSSYSVYCRLFTYLNEEGSGEPHPLGSFKVTAVSVSKVHRTPAALTADKREHFLSILAKQTPVIQQEEGVRVQRLSVKELLLNSGWFEDADAVANAQARVMLSPASFPEEVARTFSFTDTQTGCALHLLYRRRFELRESDIDFNLHLNQLAAKMLVIDAFRAAVADVRCAYSRLMCEGANPLCADLLLRRFRIDYVREIPQRYAAVDVFLFPVEVDRVKAQLLASSDGEHDMTHAEMMRIGFFTMGIPRSDGTPAGIASPDVPYIATALMFRFTAPALKKLQPLGQRVLVKRTQAAKQTKAGILIPEQVAGKINEGTVVAVAAGSKDWTPTVKADDTVLLPEYGGSAVKVDGEEFFLYDESMLLGVLSN